MDQVNVKVSFYLKKSETDADRMCPVMARLNIGKYSEAAFSVKFRVPQSMRNSGRASGKSVKAKEINNRLDEIRAMALGVYTELSAVRDGMTTGDVKSLLLGMAGGQATLLSYFRTFIENFAKRVGVNRTEGSLYTGILYSDMRLLSKEHLSLADDGTWWIRSSRRKTGVEFEIPLLDLPLRIMEKYRDTIPDGRLLPMYSNSTINLNLKRIAQLCDIDCPLGFHQAIQAKLSYLLKISDLQRVIS